MVIDKREEIEWLNYWIEDACTYKNRIILLGDSVTREIRKKLQFYMKRKYAVDLIAMSYCILDDMVLEEINHFFRSSPYKYEYIIYHMGAHHGYHITCAKSGRDAEKFADKTVEILECLKQYGLNVIAMSSTFEKESEREGRQLADHNREIEKRNQLLEEAAGRVHITFFDLNKKTDCQMLRYTDWCHFYEACYEAIAGIIIAECFPDIKYFSSNQMESISELDTKLKSYNDKKIYIYGNGIRGGRMRMYLCDRGYRFDGYIVSDEYGKTSGQVFYLNEIERENTLVIVTPVDLGIWDKLNRNQFDYITLHSDVNTFLRMYTGMT